MGQEGYIESYDPRYAVAYMDSGPSHHKGKKINLNTNYP
jgi:hypothetical protein